jgi:hypothetical protein
VSTPSWFPRSPLPIPCLASTLGRLSRRWFKPPESQKEEGRLFCV